ncbi:MAG: FtsQ-type POTRA domain-containing protein [Pseudomonadota bacterium]|nr:FtsQ-type POTRA domain-containing protein [Pseudomonadota bacterium]
MKKRIFVSIILLFVLTTYTLNKDFKFTERLKVKKIIIENISILNEKEIKESISNIYDKNIFFLKNQTIKKNLTRIDMIESFKIKKIYPDTVKIEIFEKIPIAILHDKKKKYFYTNKDEIINFVYINEYKDLPIVIGDKESFQIFIRNLKKIDFPINSIRSFYYYKIKRWDIITNKNQTIKLPTKNYNKSLKNFMNIIKNESFSKYKVFDYRINEQLILK